jgi:hypothetical protein
MYWTVWIAFPFIVIAGLDCSKISIQDRTWDLSALFTQNIEVKLEEIDHEGISTDEVMLFLNPCRQLNIKSGNEKERCPADSYACRVITNKKSLEQDRITSVKSLSRSPAQISKFDNNSTLILKMESIVPIDLKFMCQADTVLNC